VSQRSLAQHDMPEHPSKCTLTQDTTSSSHEFACRASHSTRALIR
jgi:hypothetical protein